MAIITSDQPELANQTEPQVCQSVAAHMFRLNIVTGCRHRNQGKILSTNARKQMNCKPRAWITFPKICTKLSFSTQPLTFTREISLVR